MSRGILTCEMRTALLSHREFYIRSAHIAIIPGLTSKSMVRFPLNSVDGECTEMTIHTLLENT